MEWIDLGCYRVQQILIEDLPATLKAIETDRDDGIALQAPVGRAVFIGDQDLRANTNWPCVEIKSAASFRSGGSDQSPDQYLHRVQVIFTSIDTNPAVLEMRNIRYGLALLKTLNGRSLQPEMSAELIAGNLFYTLLDSMGKNRPFVRSVGVEFTVRSLTDRGV